MKAEELKLGFLVTDCFGYIQKIEYITEKSIRAYFPELKDVGVTDFKDLKGIPITEEWLSKFSFKKNNEGDWNKDGFKLSNKYTHDGTYEFDCNYISVNILYVHQLQNLYFALTNTELEIKQNA